LEKVLGNSVGTVRGRYKVVGHSKAFSGETPRDGLTHRGS